MQPYPSTRGYWEQNYNPEFIRWKLTYSPLETQLSTIGVLRQWLSEPAFDRYDFAQAEPGLIASQLAICLVFRDTQDFLVRMQSLLGDIEQLMTVDSLMQANVARWRSLLNRSLDIIEGLKKEFRQFSSRRRTAVPLTKWTKSWTSSADHLQGAFDYPLQVVDLSSLGGSNQEAFADYVEPLNLALDLTMQKVTRVSQSLQSTLTLLESKRGISEAESVKKLTELAFLFIPLSFTASFFSMPVNVSSSTTDLVPSFPAPKNTYLAVY